MLNRQPTLLLFAGLLFVAAQANAVTCREFLGSAEDLDRALERSNIAFVVNVEVIDRGSDPKLSYTLVDPPLKGSPPTTGVLNYGDPYCAQLEFLLERGIVLVFLESLDGEVTRQNATLVALSEDGPGFGWVIDWLRAKTSNNALHPCIDTCNGTGYTSLL